MNNVFIECDLVWKVQKSRAVNSEGSFHLCACNYLVNTKIHIFNNNKENKIILELTGIVIHNYKSNYSVSTNIIQYLLYFIVLVEIYIPVTYVPNNSITMT